MQHAGAFDGSGQSAQGREADGSVSRPTPLTLVAGAVAGGNLESIAAAVAQALRCPVAIAIPALGRPVVSPEGSMPADAAADVVAYAAAQMQARAEAMPDVIAEAVAVQIADQVVGIVAAITDRRNGSSGAPERSSSGAVDRRAWLEAAATAASVTALIREVHASDPAGSAADLLAELGAGPPADLSLFLARGRRLGLELSGGGIAICARRVAGQGVASTLTAADRALVVELQTSTTKLIAQRGVDRVLAVVAFDGPESADVSLALVRRLRAAGLMVSRSAPRRNPAGLDQAVLEAELLNELSVDELTPAGQEETYRLLIGVLLRDRDELEQLRDRTVWALSDYDAIHDTELVATLRAFLSHDGSTTETAEAMRLHRHTVGYRLSRVHEVSGLSPYASDGRERLSLGIKAQQILEAANRLSQTLQSLHRDRG